MDVLLLDIFFLKYSDRSAVLRVPAEGQHTLLVTLLVFFLVSDLRLDENAGINAPNFSSLFDADSGAYLSRMPLHWKKSSKPA